MRLHVVAEELKFQVLKRRVEQAWPKAKVHWNERLEELSQSVNAGEVDIVLMCWKQLGAAAIQHWCTNGLHQQIQVVVVLPSGVKLPEAMFQLDHVHWVREPMDIHVLKSTLREVEAKTPSTKEG